jgi:hypothetical protein
MTQLEKITKRAVALREEQRVIVETFNKFSEEINNKVKATLEEAGVYETIHSLELEREERKKSDQKKVDEIVEKLKDLQKSYELLTDLESEEEVPQTAPVEPVAAVEPAVEETPAPAKSKRVPKKEVSKKGVLKKETVKKPLSKKSSKK